MNNLHAIVLLYRGTEITHEGMTNMREYLASLLQLNEMPDGYSLDDSDIVQASVARIIKFEEGSGVSKYNDAENAIIYIGTKFVGALQENNAVGFAAELASHATLAKSLGNDDRLLAAISIISNGKFSDVRGSVRKKYGINYTIFEVIQRVGRHVQNA